MSHRRPDSRSRNGEMFVPSTAYPTNKGLVSFPVPLIASQLMFFVFHIRKAPSTRQQGKEQTKTLPGSNINEKRRQPRRNVNLLHSSVIPIEENPQRTRIPRENVKFDEVSDWNQFLAANEQELKDRFAELQKKKQAERKAFFYQLNHGYSKQNSDTESEPESDEQIESSEAESEFGVSDELLPSLESVEEEIEKITNLFIRDIKKQVSKALILPLDQEKITSKHAKANFEYGDGDIIALELKRTETVAKKMDQVKRIATGRSKPISSC